LIGRIEALRHEAFKVAFFRLLEHPFARSVNPVGR
jgi:hypothetical protein